MADPESVEQWLKLSTQHEVAARALVESKVAAAQSYFHAGVAVECALKAYIMRYERLNGWPSRDARPDLYTHDLRALVEIAGIKMPGKGRLRVAWYLVLQWQRNQAYDPYDMPRKVARDILGAAFGLDGVVTWIRSNLI